MNTRRRPRPEAKPDPARRLLCVCGRSIEVLPQQHGRQDACPACLRRFEIVYTTDGVCLAYVDPKPAASPADTAAETSTSLDLPMPPENPGALTEAGLIEEPEPPDEAQFRCGCGALLAIGKDAFDKRVRCPSCGGRRLVTLAYDVDAGSFTLHTFSLDDAKTGSTRTAVRVV